MFIWSNEGQTNWKMIAILDEGQRMWTARDGVSSVTYIWCPCWGAISEWPVTAGTRGTFSAEDVPGMTRLLVTKDFRFKKSFLCSNVHVKERKSDLKWSLDCEERSGPTAQLLLGPQAGDFGFIQECWQQFGSPFLQAHTEVCFFSCTHRIPYIQWRQRSFTLVCPDGSWTHRHGSDGFGVFAGGVWWASFRTGHRRLLLVVPPVFSGPPEESGMKHLIRTTFALLLLLSRSLPLPHPCCLCWDAGSSELWRRGRSWPWWPPPTQRCQRRWRWGSLSGWGCCGTPGNSPQTVTWEGPDGRPEVGSSPAPPSLRDTTDGFRRGCRTINHPLLSD